MRTKIILTIAFLLTGLALLSGATLAWQSTSGTRLNDFLTAGVRGQISEVFTPPQNGLAAGAETEKIVNIANDSGTPIFVRVMALPIITKTDEAEDTLLPADMITLDINTEYWMDGGDGYFYYKQLLMPGETTARPLFTSVRFSASASGIYNEAELDVFVRSEVCGVNKNHGYRLSFWGGGISDKQSAVDAVFADLTVLYYID